MIRFFGLLSLYAVLGVSPAVAGVTMAIESFDSSGTADDTFLVGETVTLRVLAIDETGIAPDFSADLLAAFNAQIFGSTNDGDDGVGGTTINPGFGFASAAGDFTSGVDLAGFTGTPFDVSTAPASGVILAELSYTADVLGATDYSFNPDVNFSNLAFDVGGSLTAFDSSSAGFTLAGTSVTVIPEPSSFAAMAIGAVATVGLRRRRKR